MKKENLIIKVLFFVLILVLLIIVIKNIIGDHKQATISQDAFVKLKISDVTIPLEKGKKNYVMEMDCSKIEENVQLVYYELNEDFEEAKVSLKTYAFKDDLLLKDNIRDASNINILINVLYKKYEQNYFIELTCSVD